LVYAPQTSLFDFDNRPRTKRCVYRVFLDFSRLMAVASPGCLIGVEDDPARWICTANDGCDGIIWILS
jgi:hypothetical protein